MIEGPVVPQGTRKKGKKKRNKPWGHPAEHCFKGNAFRRRDFYGDQDYSLFHIMYTTIDLEASSLEGETKGIYST